MATGAANFPFYTLKNLPTGFWKSRQAECGIDLPVEIGMLRERFRSPPVPFHLCFGLGEPPKINSETASRWRKYFRLGRNRSGRYGIVHYRQVRSIFQSGSLARSTPKEIFSNVRCLSHRPALRDRSTQSNVILRVSSAIQKLFKKASVGVRGIIVIGIAVVVGGISALAWGQPALAHGSGTTNQSNHAEQAVVTYPQPPPGFDPLMASDKQLARYGFPPRPDARGAPESYRHWRSLVLVPRVANPTLERTTIYNGATQGASTKNEPQ